jgi:hypothetical protein
MLIEILKWLIRLFRRVKEYYSKGVILRHLSDYEMYKQISLYFARYLASRFDE